MSRSGLRLAAVITCLCSAALFAETPAELFQKAKSQVKSQSWQEALTTLDRLDAVSAAPGSEAVRQQLVAPVAFYRGVCEANLGRAEQAEADFATYLQAQPGSTIDAKVYSKKAVSAFAAASKMKSAATPATLSLLHRYEQFEAPANLGETPDARWAEGPVKWLLTPEEMAAWQALTSDAARSEFVEAFWQRRDPTPGSPDNPARTTFDRRVAFADSYFRLDEKQRGSLTDPGMVFVVLGPPYRTGRKPILATDENNISDGSSVPGYWYMAATNSVHVDGFTLTDASSGFREIWYYQALTKAASAKELSVLFVTKVGRGQFVLQRDPPILNALLAARSGTPATRVAAAAP